MPPTLTGICLITPDVIRLRAFYEQVLQVEGEGDARHVELLTAGAGLTLFSWQGMEDMAPGCMAGAGHGATIVGFEVADVDAEAARLADAGRADRQAAADLSLGHALGLVSATQTATS